MESIPPGPRYSEEFNAEDAEITYSSSDSILFRIHAINLKTHTEGLAPIAEARLDEVAYLTEPAFVLEILFRFIYPRPQPNLEDTTSINLETLNLVAEAAEKYQVYPCMYACFLQMRATLPNHAGVILGYALKHDNRSLAAEAAAVLLDRPSAEALGSIPPEFHHRWLSYLDRWREIQKLVLVYLLPDAANQQTRSVLTVVAQNPSALQNLDNLLGSEYMRFKDLVKVVIDGQEKTVLDSVLEGLNDNRDTFTTAQTSSNDRTITCSDDVDIEVDGAVLKACAPKLGALFGNGTSALVSEKSLTMLRLLRFIQPRRQPDISTYESGELMELANAAEEYRIYQAMRVCRRFVKRLCSTSMQPSMANDAFQYASRAMYFDILDLLAPKMLYLSLEDIVVTVPPDMLQAWLQYRKQWERISLNAIKQLMGYCNSMEDCAHYGNYAHGDSHCRVFFWKYAFPIINKLLEPSSLQDLHDKGVHEAFPGDIPPTCYSGRADMGRVRANAARAIEVIKPISEFMRDT